MSSTLIQGSSECNHYVSVISWTCVLCGETVDFGDRESGGGGSTTDASKSKQVGRKKKVATTFKFQVGDTVQVGTGTARFPVPRRYQDRFGVIVFRTRQGNSVLYDVDFGARRVAPLTVTQGSITG